MADALHLFPCLDHHARKFEQHPGTGKARVEVLAGAGHSPHMEAANEVNRLVGGFLDELEGEAR